MGCNGKNIAHDLLLFNYGIIDKKLFIIIGAKSSLIKREVQDDYILGLSSLIGGGFVMGAETTFKHRVKNGETETIPQGKFGILHILKLKERGLLLRTGVNYTVVDGTDAVELGAEVRFPAGPLELTFSANTQTTITGEDYSGQHVGTQVKWKDLLFSFGIDGDKIKNWDETHTHFRWFIDSRVYVDLHLLLKGTQFRGADIGFTFMSPEQPRY